MSKIKKSLIHSSTLMVLALFAGLAQAEEARVWGPTFSISVVPTDDGIHLEWFGHPALNPASRRIDTLDLTVKFDSKDTEKHRMEGVSELKKGALDLAGDWKDLRFSYKTRRPGTITTGNPRVSCRLQAKKITLPARILFESYKEGPRCTITDSSEK